MLQNEGPSRSGVRRVPIGRVAGVVALLALGFGLGPRAKLEESWVEPEVGSDVDAWLAAREAAVPGIRDGAAKGVLWADTVTHAVTPISLVYLHGFSADRHEIEPLVSDLARELGANAFFTRLAGHGQDGEALGNATAESWLADAAEAVAVGSRIGERVVLIGTSTGGTLAFWAAARLEGRARVAALVLISPNFGLKDRSAALLTWPWGGLLARLAIGRERCFEPENEAQALHWTVCYPTRVLLPMAALVERVRRVDLLGLRVPTLVVFSRGDQVVDASATERVLAAMAGREPTYFALEESGDPAAHVVVGDIMSPQTTDAVRERILEHLERAFAP